MSAKSALPASLSPLSRRSVERYAHTLGRRSLTLGLCLVAGACAPKAEGTQVKLEQISPSSADIVVGFQVGKIRASALGAMIGPLITADEDLGDVARAATECKLNLDQMRFTVVSSMASEGDNMFIAAESPGIGNEDTLLCMERVASGESAPVAFTTAGKVRTSPGEDGGLLISANENYVIFVTAAWKQDVLDRVNGETGGSPAGLASTWKQVDQGADIYFGVEGDDAVRSELAGLPGADTLTSITGSLSAGENMAMTAGVHYEAAATATQAQAELQGMLTELSPAMIEEGLPKAMVDSASVKADGDTVTLHFEAASADLAALAMLAGSM